MRIVIGLTAGAILAVVLILIENRRGFGFRAYAVGLFAAALVYVLFAVVGGGSTAWFGIEAVGLGVFGGAAWLGYQRPLFLVLGWAAHVGWDVFLHLTGPGATYTPNWYPWVCVSFDLMIAGAVMMMIVRQRAATARSAA